MHQRNAAESCGKQEASRRTASSLVLQFSWIRVFRNRCTNLCRDLRKNGAGIAFVPIVTRYLLVKYSCKLESVWGA